MSGADRAYEPVQLRLIVKIASMQFCPLLPKLRETRPQASECADDRDSAAEEVQSKPHIETVPEIARAIQSVESELGGQGRVLVRYSGTQPLCRIMVEGPDETATRQLCLQVSDIIRKNIGI